MREDYCEGLESRDLVISETEFGAMGDREKITVRAQVEFERTQHEKVEGVGDVGPYHQLKDG